MTTPTQPLLVGDLGIEGVAEALQGSGLGLQIGPFRAWMQCSVPEVADSLFRFYQHHPRLSPEQPFSFHVRLDLSGRSRRHSRQNVCFSVDGRIPHEDRPRAHALAVFEWGINLVLALRAHHLLMFHAAVVERNGLALLLPGQPGAGKTTLCAALAHEGFRYFSDEFGLVRPESTEALPIPRPLPLKNQSVDIIRSRYPEAEFGPIIAGTHKGDVTHMVPPADSVAQASTPARIAAVVLPEYRPNARGTITEMSPDDAFMALASNAFNYEMLGEAAFQTVSAVVRSSPCYRLQYANLDDAIRWLRQLTTPGTA